MSYLTFCPLPLAEVLLTMLFRRFYGGYAFLKYGTVGRALQDLTGAVVQSVPASGPLLGGAVPRSTLLIAISSSVSIFDCDSICFRKPNIPISGKGHKTSTIWLII